MILSHQESIEALATARQALENYRGKFWFGNLAKVEREFVELGLFEETERSMHIDIALQEINHGDRRGPDPPGDVSSHPPFPNLKLYAFCWYSPELQKRMYMKFALSLDCVKPRLVLYSFHESGA